MSSTEYNQDRPPADDSLMEILAPVIVCILVVLAFVGSVIWAMSTGIGFVWFIVFVLGVIILAACS